MVGRCLAPRHQDGVRGLRDGEVLDMYTIYQAVLRKGGSAVVDDQEIWPLVAIEIGYMAYPMDAAALIENVYRVGRSSACARALRATRLSISAFVHQCSLFLLWQDSPSHPWCPGGVGWNCF